MITIYHNNSCTKSRLALAEIEASEQPFKIINYLENAPSVQELSNIVTKLGIRPKDLVRTTEKIYQQEFKGKELTDHQWIIAMHENPVLIQRPILIKGDLAIIGRSEEALDQML